MKKTLFLCVAAATVFFTACSEKETNPQSYVEVVGTAEKEVDPDIFYLNFTINETSNAPKGNITALEEKILEAFRLLNIDTKTDLSVTNMSGDNWYWWRKSRNVTQYKSYELKASNLEMMNKVCDKLDSIGYVNYYLTKVDYSKMDDLKKEVQQEAVKKARIKADNLLSGENRQVEHLIYLQEQEVFNNAPMYRYADYANKEMALTESAPAPSVDFKKMKISYNVVARFSIK